MTDNDIIIDNLDEVSDILDSIEESFSDTITDSDMAVELSKVGLDVNPPENIDNIERQVIEALNSALRSLPYKPEQYSYEQLRNITVNIMDQYYNQDDYSVMPDNSVIVTDDDIDRWDPSEKACEDKKGKKKRKKPELDARMVAELILFREDVRYITATGDEMDDTGMLGIYQREAPNEGIYVESERNIRKIIKDLQITYSDRILKDVTNYLKAEAKCVTLCEDPSLIPLGNGIYNYHCREKDSNGNEVPGELEPFDPNIVFTRKIPVNYITGNPPVNPHFKLEDGTDWDVESWMESLTDSPTELKLLWQIPGAIIRPNQNWGKVCCLWGRDGSNGKSTYATLLKALCGDKAYVSIAFNQFSKEYYLSRLVEAMAIITDENPTDVKIDDPSNFKAIVTGDTFMINRKYKDPITIRFKGLMVQCTNSLPRSSDKTESYYRRFLMIPFTKVFKGASEHKEIKESILKEPKVLEYVLWKVLNLPKYYTLIEPDVCVKLLDKYREDNDPTLQFVYDVFPSLGFDKVPQNYIYDVFQQWCTANKVTIRDEGRNTILDNIRNHVSTYYGNEWEYKEGTIRIGKNDNLKMDPIIDEYHLDTKWIRKLCNYYHRAEVEEFSRGYVRR